MNEFDDTRHTLRKQANSPQKNNKHNMSENTTSADLPDNIATSTTKTKSKRNTDTNQTASTKSYPFVPSISLVACPIPSPFIAKLDPPTGQQEAVDNFMEACSSPAYYVPTAFGNVMDNLIRNPNITSSHLFRADVMWDSERDSSFEPQAWALDGNSESGGNAKRTLSTFVSAMRVELRPRYVAVEGFELRRCVVREFVPRNTTLDKRLVQTCAFFRRRSTTAGKTLQTEEEDGKTKDGHHDGIDGLQENVPSENHEGEEENKELNLVVYIPHVKSEDELPWYHPRVKALAFLHNWRRIAQPVRVMEPTPADMTAAPGYLSLHILPFTQSSSSSTPQTSPDSSNANRLLRTLLSLLTTIHTHGHGTLTGYTKRVHHDRLLSQSALQDIYTRFKTKYASDLLNKYWQETTDARKGVFEDLGIASFLIGLWEQMYDVSACIPLSEEQKHEQCTTIASSTVDAKNDDLTTPNFSKSTTTLPPFPGWVDIGCGNGILTFILISEGYPGLAFDARSRKTWDAFPAAIRAHLHEMILVPAVLGVQVPTHVSGPELTSSPTPTTPAIRNGGEGNTSATPQDKRQVREMPRVHDGKFPRGTFVISNHADELTPWTPLLAHMSGCPFMAIPCCSHSFSGARWRAPTPGKKQKSTPATETPESSTTGTEDAAKGGKTGSLASPVWVQGRAVSAYASLCAYVQKLAEEVGFVVETEALRIPSTRNVAVVGRFVRGGNGAEGSNGGHGDGGFGEDSEDDEGHLGQTEEENGGERDAKGPNVPVAEAYDEADDREGRVRRIIRREMGRDVRDVGREWVERIEALVKNKGRNH